MPRAEAGLAGPLAHLAGALPLAGWPMSSDITIAYRCPDGPGSRQVFEDGSLTAWVLDETDPSDLEVRWESRRLELLWTAPDRLTAADLSTLRFSMPSADRRYGLLPSDPATLDLCGALPRIPGATMTVRYEITDGVRPGLELTHTIRDGALVEARYGGEHDPDSLVVVASWAWVLELLRGQCGLLDLMHHGRVIGQIPSLSLATGILESEEHIAAWRPHDDAYDVIDDWVDMVTSPAGDALRAALSSGGG